MGKLTHEVSGNIASFRSAARVPIESLKCHFKPIQEGSGDPSPNNVRPISGWNQIETTQNGYNIWDEQWELGLINTDSGQKVDSSIQIRAKNDILVKPSTEYYIYYGPLGGDVWVMFFDKNSNIIAEGLPTGFNTTSSGKALMIKNAAFITPNNCAFIRFYLTKVYGTTYNNNVSINYPATNHSYNAYIGSKIPTTFPVLGKNLFNPNFNWETSTTYRYIYLSELEQECNLSFQLKDSTIDVSDVYIGFCYEEPVSVDAASKGYRWCLERGIIKSYDKINRVKETNDSANLNKICKYLIIYPKNAYTRLLSAYDIQLEYGTSATTYEPYSSNNTVYGGYVDIAKGEVVSEFECKIYTGNSSELWQREGLTEGSNFYIMTPETWKRSTKNIDLYCNLAESLSSTVSFAVGTVRITSTGNFNLYIGPVLNITSVQELRDWLSTHNLQIACRLNNPIHYPLTPQQLKTFLDQNNIWSNTNDITEVSYQIHDSAMIQAAKKQIAAFTTRMEQETRPPAAYQRLQYIGAENATPYIDTGLTYPSEPEVEIHFYNSKNESFVFGVRKAMLTKPYFNLNVSSDSDKIRFDFYDKKVHVANSNKTGEKLFTFHNRTATFTHLDTSVVETTDYSSYGFSAYTDNPILLFAVNTGGSASLGDTAGSLRIYSVKFWFGGVLAANFVPCKRKSDNVVGMYDIVRKQFYTSVNSDVFTAGPAR